MILNGNFRKGGHIPLAVVCRPPSQPTFCSFLWEATHARTLSLTSTSSEDFTTHLSELKKRSVETQFGASFRKVSFLKLYAKRTVLLDGRFFQNCYYFKGKRQSCQFCLAYFAQISLLSLARRRLILLEILLINNFENINERNLISKGIKTF